MAAELISLEESRRLVELEEVIERGVSTFIAVGEALAEIRDKRLYRVTHGTFEEYCREEWNMSRMQASRLIGAAEVVENVTHGLQSTAPSNERQARPLTKLPAEKQPEAWAKAVEAANGSQPTARQVEAAVAEVVAPTQEEARAIPQTQLSDDEQSAVDEAEKDSETLWSLKRHWRKASKKERAAFMEWMKTAR